MITKEKPGEAAMAVEYYLVERYGERAEPTVLSNADLAAELHELVNELPELSGLVDAAVKDPNRDVAGDDVVALRRQLGGARRRTAAVWEEFTRRFGGPRARFL